MKMLAVTTKDLKILIADRGAWSTLFLMPLMFITIMSLALGPLFRSSGDAAIRLPVAVEDDSAQAQKVFDGLKGINGFTLETQLTAADGSKRALARADAEAMVKDGRRVAALIIPAGFGRAVEQGTTAQVVVLQDAAQANTAALVIGATRGVLAQIQGETQAARGADAFLRPFEAAVRQLPPQAQTQFDFTQIKAQAYAQAKLATEHPPITVDAQSVAANNVQSVGVYEQNVPGFSVMFVFFIVSYVAQSVLTEKRDGTFRRLMAAPVSKAALLAGKLLPNFLVGLAQVSVMFTVGHFVFGMQLGHDLLALVLVTVAVSLAATGLGILVASLAKSEQQISGVTSLIILTLAALGGSMVPLFVMPDFMQTIAHFTPHAWALTTYQNIIVRGYGTVEVLPQVGVLLAFASAFFGVALWRFKFE
jgi:ABC-2 type transport system permease protein